MTAPLEAMIWVLRKKNRKKYPLILDTKTFLGKFITGMAGWLMGTLQLNLKGPDWRLVYSPHKTPLIAIELKEERPQKKTEKILEN